jgi:hypothetical protein
MAWHRPRFRLLHLISLVAVVAAELSILPVGVSGGVVVLTVASAVLASVSGPLLWIEWATIVAIHAILIALLVPAIQHSHGRRSKATPATTTAPASGKI